jgi:rare lipoprotein A
MIPARGRAGDVVRTRMARVAFSASIALLLANCGSVDKFGARVDPRYGVASGPRIVDEDERAPKGGGVYRVGKAYQVAGRTYTPEHNPSYSNEGLASWYGGGFHGRRTANGEVFDMYSISAAHPTLPLPCYARVTNLANHRSIVVRINDRGPYAGNRVIDLSSKTADLLGYKGHGLARVRVEYVGDAAHRLAGTGAVVGHGGFRDAVPAAAAGAAAARSRRRYSAAAGTAVRRGPRAIRLRA